MIRKTLSRFLPLLLLLALLAGCGADAPQNIPSGPEDPGASVVVQPALKSDGKAGMPDQWPAYAGEPYVAVNDNEPFFSQEDRGSLEPFETFAELDDLGRCGVTYANVCQELMPTEERGEIGQVKPSGWHTIKFDFVDGKYLYNRCHLLGFQLTGENANKQNLITGTRALNIDGMLPFENLVADYVQETDHHVLYRVTPIFEGDNLVASGVLMEGWSVEDKGEGVCFSVYAFNAQPGVVIDYATGDAWEGDPTAGSAPGSGSDSAQQTTYILNTNTMKYHLPSCQSAQDMNPANRQEYTGPVQDLLDQGYEPCGRCKP